MRFTYLRDEVVAVLRKPHAFRITMALAILVVFAVHVLDFPGSVPRFRQLSGGGVLLDIAPSFQVDKVYERVASYGSSGRDEYTFRNLTVDLVLPLSVFPFLYLFMAKAANSARLTRPLMFLLFSFAVGYVVFDLAENAAVLILLSRYPERVELVAAILPYVTVVKRAASLLALAVPVALLVFGYVVKSLRPAKVVV